MQVEFFRFTKAWNSTRVPSSGGTVFECEMRTGFSTRNPQLEIRTENTTILKCNFFYISALGAYYDITDCVYNAEENFFLVSGRLDVLATCRDNILNSYQWVTRWSGSTDVSIADDLAPVISQSYLRGGQNAYTPFSITTAFSNSCVVLNLAGTGRICMTGYHYNKLMLDFTHKSDPLDVGNYITHDLARLWTNPMSYIESAMCIPIEAVGGGHNGRPIMAGATDSAFEPHFSWYVVPEVQAWRCQHNVDNFEDVIGVASHPDAVEVGDYLNYPPYTDVKLYVAGIGIIQLDNNRITGGENLRVQTTIDYVTGVIIVRVKKESSNQVVGYATGQLGYSLNFAQAHSADIVGAAGSVIMGAVSGGVYGGPAGAMIGGAGGAMSAVGSLGNSSGVTVHGSTGGAGAWYDANGQFITVMQTFKRVRKPNNLLLGLPYNRTARLGDLMGYVKCATADVYKPNIINQEDRLAIKDYLMTGVLLE